MSVYNDEPFIEQSIQSILDQSFTDFELIIIDDGAIDNSVSKIQTFNDSRLRLIRQANHGLAHALNTAIKEARGVFIARQDADDISLPERIERQVRILEEVPGIGIVGCNANLIDPCGNVFYTTSYPLTDSNIRHALFEDESNPFIHGAVIFAKDIAVKAGLYRPQFKYCQDLDLWLRMADITRMTNIPTALYSWRFRSGSMGASNRINKNDYMRLAFWCAKQRRMGAPEPPLSVEYVRRAGFTSIVNRFRQIEDPALAFRFNYAQRQFLTGHSSVARAICREVLAKQGLNLYAWLLLILSFFPPRISAACWSNLQRVYRAGTWKH